MAAATDLEKRAGRVGLNWSIAYKASPGEPHAFHLVYDKGVPVEPSQVIGETEEQARDTISLAAASLKKKPAASSSSSFPEAVAALVQPRWKESEAEFLKHFDLPYDDFCMMATVMGEKFPDKLARYEKIREMDEEAAILWIIKHARSYGILKEG